MDIQIGIDRKLIDKKQIDRQNNIKQYMDRQTDINRKIIDKRQILDRQIKGRQIDIDRKMIDKRLPGRYCSFLQLM